MTVVSATTRNGSLSDPDIHAGDFVSDEPIRVLIVDDNFVVRRGLQSSLELDPGMHVVGQAANGEEALERVEALAPDVVLMDIRMPVRDGVSATQILSDEYPNARILVLTWSEEPDHLRAAVLAGAKGYLVHGRFSPERLAEAVRVVHGGGALITPAIAPALLDLVRDTARGKSGKAGPSGILTPRELEVLELIVGGKSNREISEALFIEEKTVKNHVSNIYAKLHLKNRYEAIARGRDHLR